MPGRQFAAEFPRDYGKPLELGYDSHVSADAKDGVKGDQLIFFASDQLLPLFLVGKNDHKRAAEVAKELAAELERCAPLLPADDAAATVQDTIGRKLPASVVQAWSMLVAPVAAGAALATKAPCSVM